MVGCIEVEKRLAIAVAFFLDTGVADVLFSGYRFVLRVYCDAG